MAASQLDALGVELGVEGVGKGVLAEALHRLGDQEEGDHPAGQIADGVEEAVVAGGGDHAGDAEEGGGGEVIAGKGDAVDEPMDAAAGGIVAGGGGGAPGQIERKAEDKNNEGNKQ